MANKLVFETMVDAGGFARGVREMEMLAGVAGGRMSAAMAGGFLSHGGPGGGISGVIRESLVVLREWGRGNFTRMPGSALLLTQYLGGISLLFKSTASGAIKAAQADRQLTESMALSALAARDKAAASKAAVVASNLDEGASLRQALADNAAAVAATRDAEAQGAKALASERAARIALASGSTSLTALGWIGVAAIAVAIPLYFVWRHFRKINQEQKNFADLTDATKHKFSEEAAAAMDDARAHEEISHWLKEELQNRRPLEEVVDRRIKKLREEAAALRDLAEAQGANSSQLNKMDVQELQKEQAILKAAVAEAHANLLGAQTDLATANVAYTKNPKIQTPEGAVDILGAKKAEANSKAIVDAVKAAMKDKTYSYFTGTYTTNPTTGIPIANTASRPANENDMFSVKVGDTPVRMSLKQAKEAYERNANYVNQLTNSATALNDAVQSGKDSVKNAKNQFDKLSGRLKDVQDEIDIKSGIGAKAAAARDSELSNIRGEDSMVRVGNFLGASRSGIDSTAAEQVRIAREQLFHLRHIDDHLTSGGGGGGTPHFSPS